jgi:hypothetical protein
MGFPLESKKKYLQNAFKNILFYNQYNQKKAN